MRCFFDSLLCQEDLIKNNNPITLATKIAVNNAAKETATAIKLVWRHHFGIRLIDGKGTMEGEVDTSRIMIVGEKEIAKKISDMFSEWKDIERLSRR